VTTISGEQVRRGITSVTGVVASIDRFEISRGRTGSAGGGIYNTGALTISNSSLHHNESVGPGSGLYNYYGFVAISNSTISNNTSGAPGISGCCGAAITNINGQMRINNSTITGNKVTGAMSMGGVYSGGTSDLANVILRNTIVIGNDTGVMLVECGGFITSAGYNLIENTNLCPFWQPSASDVVNGNPQLGPLLGSPAYHPLRYGSPAIDMGDPSGCKDHNNNLIISDQRSVQRSGRCDIGAYEYQIPGQPAELLAWGGSGQSAHFYSNFAFPLQVVVLDSWGSPVSGTSVTFMAPVTGPSARFTIDGSNAITVSTDADGVATTPPFTPNDIAGSYLITSLASPVTSTISFTLTNLFLSKTYLPAVTRNYCANFFDDFSNPFSGWPVGESDFVLAQYLNGEYRIQSKQPYLFLFRSPACERDNYVVEADVRWDGTVSSDIGLLFGLTECVNGSWTPN
jgi:hypothetical protein